MTVTVAAQHHPHIPLARRIELLRRRLYPLLHPVRTRPDRLAAEMRARHDRMLAAATTRPDLLADIHAFLDVDPDTAYPWPGDSTYPAGGPS